MSMSTYNLVDFIGELFLQFSAGPVWKINISIDSVYLLDLPAHRILVHIKSLQTLSDARSFVPANSALYYDCRTLHHWVADTLMNHILQILNAMMWIDLHGKCDNGKSSFISLRPIITPATLSVKSLQCYNVFKFNVLKLTFKHPSRSRVSLYSTYSTMTLNTRIPNYPLERK